MGMKITLNLLSNTLFFIALILSMSLVSTNSLSEKDSTESLIKETESEELEGLFPNGWFNIVGKTGLCVSARNNNGRLVQERCSNNANVTWRADRFRNGYMVRARNGRVMDNAGQGNRNGNPVLGYRRNNTPAQIWAIYRNHGHHVAFKNIQRNRCLDDTGRAHPGQGYHIWSCNNGNRNQWFLLRPFNRPRPRPTR